MVHIAANVPVIAAPKTISYLPSVDCYSQVTLALIRRRRAFSRPAPVVFAPPAVRVSFADFSKGEFVAMARSYREEVVVKKYAREEARRA